MPLRLPDRLPAIEFLREENIFVLGDERANAQDIRPLRIAILNLMPLKITTETDLIRLLSNSPLQLEVHLMKVKAHTSKNTPIEHMRATSWHSCLAKGRYGVFRKCYCRADLVKRRFTPYMVCFPLTSRRRP